MSLMTFHLDNKITLSDIRESFNGRVVIRGDKLFIPSFFHFQYSESKPNFNARLSAIKKLQVAGFMDEFENLIKDENRHSVDSQPTVSGVSVDSPSISNSISIGNSIGDRSAEERGDVAHVAQPSDDEPLSPKDLELAYREYPRKEGKSQGLAKLKTQIKTKKDLNKFSQAVEKYKRHCRDTAVEPRFVKQFSTFASCWKDWLDHDAGLNEHKPPPAKNTGVDFSKLVKRREDLIP